MKFEDLRLAEPILRAVAAEGYATPTPIQAKAIPHIIDGKDLLGCAQTGTGKTAAFALPIIHRLGAHKTPGPRALILCPTRELAAQINDSFKTYGKHAHLRLAVIFGGVGYRPQIDALKRGVDVVIATPGRLKDLINQRACSLANVEIFVLDEADRMLDMGFIHDIREVAREIPKVRQTLLFSATMPNDIRKLAQSLLTHPVSVEVAPVSSAAETVEQSVYFVDRKMKPRVLRALIEGKPDRQRTLVFTRTKHGADKVAEVLCRGGIPAEAIHGNKRQNVRIRTLENFRSGRTPVLVATDIAARGIDIDEIRLVVNYDLPNEAETYVHRIGRTGRAGASGQATSLCDHEERSNLRDIERLIRRPITVMKMMELGLEDDARESHAPRDGHASRQPSHGSHAQGGSHPPREQHRKPSHGHGASHSHGHGQHRSDEQPRRTGTNAPHDGHKPRQPHGNTGQHGDRTPAAQPRGHAQTGSHGQHAEKKSPPRPTHGWNAPRSSAGYKGGKGGQGGKGHRKGPRPGR